MVSQLSKSLRKCLPLRCPKFCFCIKSLIQIYNTLPDCILSNLAALHICYICNKSTAMMRIRKLGEKLVFLSPSFSHKALDFIFFFIYFFSPRDLHYIVFSKVAFTSTIFYLSSSDKYPLFLFSFINLRSFSRFIFLIPTFPNTLLFHNFKSCFRVCNLLVRTKLGVTWKL